MLTSRNKSINLGLFGPPLIARLSSLQFHNCFEVITFFLPFKIQIHDLLYLIIRVHNNPITNVIIKPLDEHIISCLGVRNQKRSIPQQIIKLCSIFHHTHILLLKAENFIHEKIRQSIRNELTSKGIPKHLPIVSISHNKGLYSPPPSKAAQLK